MLLMQLLIMIIYQIASFLLGADSYSTLDYLVQSSFFLVRSDLQVANAPLVSVERFSVGGAFSVRGYRQDVLLGDSGLFSSAELRATVLRIPKWEANLELTPFMDFGKVWNVDGENLLENNLVSIGIGMRFQVRDDFAVRLDWGIPLVEVENIGESLQENGVYFSLEFKPF